MFVVIDWRPYALPEAYGPFTSELVAGSWARVTFGEQWTDGERELPDGIIVRELTVRELADVVGAS